MSQHLPTGSPPPGPNHGYPGQQATPVTKVEMLIEYARAWKVARLVETGLYMGGGSGMGVVDAGVIRQEDYIIVDLQPANCETARSRYPLASVFCGDSAEILPHIVDALELAGQPALFWLDAHGIETDHGWPGCPLIAELDALHGSALGHVVLIDDLHMMGGHDWPSLRELRGYTESSKWDVSESHDIMRLTPARG